LEREARRRGKAFVLLTLDVDAFKPINDEHGHPVGDKVLVRIAETLLQHSDWEEGCFRSGGDEFAMLLPCGDLEQAQQISRQSS
jgi:diguanylate cyclase (GGDEF)-like protein